SWLSPPLSRSCPATRPAGLARGSGGAYPESRRRTRHRPPSSMRIACILTDMYEDPEFDEPFAALKQAGHDLTIVGLKAGQTVKGKQGKSTATVDRSFADVKPDQFGALFIPGGYSPDRLRAHDEAVQFVRAF